MWATWELPAMIITLPSPSLSMTASARSTAALKKQPGWDAASVFGEGMGRNCFGMWLLLAGQSLVPNPPAMIIQSLNMG
jgi:hypothetical protein